MQTSFQFEDDLGVEMAGCLAKVILVKLFVNLEIECHINQWEIYV